MVTHTPKFEEIAQWAMQLSEPEKQELVEMLRPAAPPDTLPEPPYPESMFMPDPNPPTFQQLIEDGTIGSWAEELGDQDTVEWLNEQKAKRQRKYLW